MYNKFIKFLFFIFAIFCILGGIANLFAVANGGTVSYTSSRTGRYVEADGMVGFIFSIVIILIGIITLYILFHKVEEDTAIEGTQEEYPNCRWWKTDDEWHNEHNPMRVMPYPPDGICPLCNKRIEKRL